MTLPPVPDEFYWTDEIWGAALRCRPLSAIAPHLFTTRQLQLSSPADELLMAAAVGASRAVLLTQVHGAEVVIVREGETPHDGKPQADVILSNAAAVAIAVKAADCVPLLIGDRTTGTVAAVHAGWRGTASGAAVAAVDALEREFGSNRADLVVAIGPSIGPCCYEVGSDLVDAFAAAGHERYLIDRWFMTPRGGKMRLDVPGSNRDQLILAGVREENVHAAALCTAEHLDLLTSYRAEKERAGRIAGVIRAATAAPR